MLCEWGKGTLINSIQLIKTSVMRVRVGLHGVMGKETERKTNGTAIETGGKDITTQ